MNGKTVIITGGNGGLGKETAKGLAFKGAKVILACRNLETGKQARDEIIKATNNQNVLLKKIDLSSQKSVREFANDIILTEQRLDVLIHNAGIVVSKRLISKDGLEMTMATNHFGPFLLTHLLIDLLKNSQPSRIVVVTSITHFLGSADLKNINNTKSMFPMWNYCNSKFANVCFTKELAQRLKGTNVTVNSTHPGFIRTNIWNSVPFPFNIPVKIMDKTFFKTSMKGAETIVYLASSEEISDVSGKYFVNCKQAYVCKRAQSDKKSNKLWKMSQQILNLNDYTI